MCVCEACVLRPLFHPPRARGARGGGPVRGSRLPSQVRCLTFVFFARRPLEASPPPLNIAVPTTRAPRGASLRVLRPELASTEALLSMPIGDMISEQQVEDYLAKWKVEEAVQAAINSAIRSRASDPIMHVADFLEARGRAAEQETIDSSNGR